MTTPTVDQSATAEADDAIDDEFAESPPSRRLPLVTRVLGLCLVLTLGFGAGVLVQKNQAGASVGTGLPAGFPGGGTAFPGGGAGGFPGPGGGGSAGSGGTTGTGNSSSASTSPSVVGTVVSISGSDVTVKDLGGTTHIVHLSDTTRITATISASSLTSGTTVSVVGPKDASGNVDATAITAQQK